MGLRNRIQVSNEQQNEDTIYIFYFWPLNLQKPGTGITYRNGEKGYHYFLWDLEAPKNLLNIDLNYSQQDTLRQVPVLQMAGMYRICKEKFQMGS